MKLNNLSKWFIHLIGFIFAQGFFIISDNWKIWEFIYFNDYGKDVLFYLNKWIGHYFLYETNLFNLITVIWIIGFFVITIKYMMNNKNKEA